MVEKKKKKPVKKKSIEGGEKKPVKKKKSLEPAEEKKAVKKKKSKEPVETKARSAGDDEEVAATTKKKKSGNSSNHGAVKRIPRGGAQQVEVSRTIVIVWVLVGLGLVFDLATTFISFAAFAADPGECCGEEIDLGGLSLGITIPYFFLIVTELSLLTKNIQHTLCTPRAQLQREAAARADYETLEWLDFLGETTLQKAFNGMLLLNPFFGFMVAWMLLYQSNPIESKAVLGLEAASMVLHFTSIYMEGAKQTRCSMIIHFIPVVPFLVTVIVTIVYLQLGGVCYLVEDTLFWYQGCHVCENSTLPEDGLCPDGNEGGVGSYCSPEENFCWFPY